MFNVFCQILKKNLHITFDDNLYIGSRIVPCEHRDRHDEVNTRTWIDIGNASKTRLVSLLLLSEVTLIFWYTH